MSETLTPTQWRKLRYLAKVGETRNPGDVTTTYSLVVRGLVAADEHGTYPTKHISYRVTDKGRAAVEAEANV